MSTITAESVARLADEYEAKICAGLYLCPAERAHVNHQLKLLVIDAAQIGSDAAFDEMTASLMKVAS